MLLHHWSLNRWLDRWLLWRLRWTLSLNLLLLLQLHHWRLDRWLLLLQRWWGRLLHLRCRLRSSILQDDRSVDSRKLARVLDDIHVRRRLGLHDRWQPRGHRKVWWRRQWRATTTTTTTATSTETKWHRWWSHGRWRWLLWRLLLLQE